MAMYLSIIGFTLVMIICLVMCRGRYHVSNIIRYEGNSGWHPGPAWMMSIGLGEYCFAGISACTHIAEELPSPGRKLPQVM